MQIIIIFLCGIFLQSCLTLQQEHAIEPKIVGGVPVKSFDGVKHMVSIRLKELEKAYEFGYGHICGGSLINRTAIVTAAHCFLDLTGTTVRTRTAKEFVVVMGTLNRLKRTSSTFQSDVKQIYSHQKFSINTLENDIAIMIMEQAVPSSYKFIAPIPLSNQTYQAGKKCNVTGWGTTSSGASDNGSYDLLQANIQVIDKKKCSESYININKLRNGMFCAGQWSGGMDSCQGDSGGPLTLNGTLIGVVSWGEGCGQRFLPGIYSDVNYYGDWIRTNSSNRNKIQLMACLVVILNAFWFLFSY